MDSNRSSSAHNNRLQFKIANPAASHAYGFFPGNRSTSVTLQPALDGSESARQKAQNPSSQLKQDKIQLQKVQGALKQIE